MWEILPGTQTQTLNFFFKPFQQTFHLSKQTWNSPAYYYLNSGTHELTDLRMQIGFLRPCYMYPTVISPVDFISGNAIGTNATVAFNMHSRRGSDTEQCKWTSQVSQNTESMTIDCALIFLLCQSSYWTVSTLNFGIDLKQCLCVNLE